MPDRTRRTATGYQYPFPTVPQKWGQEERQFAQGLRSVFDILFSRVTLAKMLYPVGSVVFSTKETPPFSFGEWEAVQTGISALNAWERTA
jgi:hypothetical protein